MKSTIRKIILELVVNYEILKTIVYITVLRNDLNNKKDSLPVKY